MGSQSSVEQLTCSSCATTGHFIMWKYCLLDSDLVRFKDLLLKYNIHIISVTENEFCYFYFCTMCEAKLSHIEMPIYIIKNIIHNKDPDNDNIRYCLLDNIQ